MPPLTGVQAAQHHRLATTVPAIRTINRAAAHWSLCDVRPQTARQLAPRLARGSLKSSGEGAGRGTYEVVVLAHDAGHYVVFAQVSLHAQLHALLNLHPNPDPCAFSAVTEPHKAKQSASIDSGSQAP